MLKTIEIHLSISGGLDSKGPVLEMTCFYPFHHMLCYSTSTLSCKYLTVDSWFTYTQTKLGGIFWSLMGQEDGSPYILLST